MCYSIHGNYVAHGGRIKAKNIYWLLREADLSGVWWYVRYDHGNVDKVIREHRVRQQPTVTDDDCANYVLMRHTNCWL